MLCKAEAMDWDPCPPIPTLEPLQENVFTQKPEPSPEGAGQAGPWKRPQSGGPWDSRSPELLLSTLGGRGGMGIILEGKPRSPRGGTRSPRKEVLLSRRLPGPRGSQGQQAVELGGRAAPLISETRRSQ